MYEYEVLNVSTDERSFMWGGNPEDAYRKSNLTKDEWKIIYTERIED